CRRDCGALCRWACKRWVEGLCSNVSVPSHSTLVGNPGCQEGGRVMVQRELEFPSVRESGNTRNGGLIHERATQPLRGFGEGGHPAAAPRGTEAGVRPVGPVRHPADPVRPLAAGVLRERRRRLRPPRPTPPGCRERPRAYDRGPGGEAAAHERGPGRTHGGGRAAKKRTWGALKGVWVPHDTRDQLVAFVNRWSQKTGIAVVTFLLWLGWGRRKWHHWKGRYGQAHEHHAWIPGD